MSEFATANCPYLSALECHHRAGLPVECYELDFESTSALVNVDYRANITSCELRFGDVAREHNAVVFVYSIHGVRADMP